MKTHTFQAKIEEGRGGGALVRVPIDVEKEFGTKGQLKVRVTFDGVPYRGSIAPMGGAHVLGIRKAIRESLGKGIGDSVKVVLERDTEERTVDVPAELQKAFKNDPDARRVYDELSYTHRREYAQWVREAKKQETRDRRAAKAIEQILSS